MTWKPRVSSTAGCWAVRKGVALPNGWISIFFGHQLVAHLDHGRGTDRLTNEVDGKDVPVPHFGVVLDWDHWHRLAAALARGRCALWHRAGHPVSGPGRGAGDHVLLRSGPATRWNSRHSAIPRDCSRNRELFSPVGPGFSALARGMRTKVSFGLMGHRGRQVRPATRPGGCHGPDAHCVRHCDGQCARAHRSADSATGIPVRAPCLLRQSEFFLWPLPRLWCLDHRRARGGEHFMQGVHRLNAGQCRQ